MIGKVVDMEGTRLNVLKLVAVAVALALAASAVAAPKTTSKFDETDLDPGVSACVDFTQ